MEFHLAEGDEICQLLLQTTGVDEMTAQLLLEESSVMRLNFEEGHLISKDVGDWGGDWNFGCQKEEEIGFPLAQTPIYQLGRFHYATYGLHSVGGVPPHGFQMPSHPDLPVSCQYIAKISQKDPVFNWIPFEVLHLVYPLFVSTGPLFMDYSNPLSPKIIETTVMMDHTFKCVTTKTILEYEHHSFEVKGLAEDPSDCRNDNLGNTGIPFWIQHPEHPRCPVSGRLMRFLCSLESGISKIVRKENVGPEDASIQRYLDVINFWCDGCLFVFVEPETKIVCMLIQNT